MNGVPAHTLAIGPLVRAFGVGVGRAQANLDMVSLRVARSMGGLDPRAVSGPGGPAPAPGAGPDPLRFPSGRAVNLLELGFSPVFYRFTEAVMDLKVAVSTSQEVARSQPLKPRVKVKAKVGLSGVGVKVSTVTGQYASRYQFSSDASSRVRSRIASVPAPALLQERIAAMAARDRAGAAPANEAS